MSVSPCRLGPAQKGPGLLYKESGLYSTRRDEVSKVLKQKGDFEGGIVILPKLIKKQVQL